MGKSIERQSLLQLLPPSTLIQGKKPAVRWNLLPPGSWNRYKLEACIFLSTMAPQSRINYALLLLSFLVLSPVILGRPPDPSPPKTILACLLDVLGLAACTPIVFLGKLLGITPSCCRVVESVTKGDLDSCRVARLNMIGLLVSIPGDENFLGRRVQALSLLALFASLWGDGPSILTRVCRK